MMSIRKCKSKNRIENQNAIGLIRPMLRILTFIFFASILSISSYAQENPPKPITVTVSKDQDLTFGAFIQTGISGTVTVGFDNSRQSTGDIILPYLVSNYHLDPTPALFVVTALPGTLISIQALGGGSIIQSTLSGNHGGILDLRIDLSTQCNKGTSFVATSGSTNVFIGGTLTVGSLSADPAGDYGGTFDVTFIQQ